MLGGISFAVPGRSVLFTLSVRTKSVAVARAAAHQDQKPAGGKVMSQQQERRRFHRFPFDAVCRLDLGAGGVWDCELLDLSINGALIRLGDDPVSRRKAESLVDNGSLHLRLSGQQRNDRVVLDLMVRAVRVQADTLACRFVAVDEESFARLKALVADNLGDSAMLERELTQLDYWPGLSISPSD
ncbi:MAG: PilZ domain-containing protein [Wenzhouxiangella sp.]|nr:MAG: PilZ domain-containing protein [Wenzhouxiangella sp.]